MSDENLLSRQLSYGRNITWQKGKVALLDLLYKCTNPAEALTF